MEANSINNFLKNFSTDLGKRKKVAQKKEKIISTNQLKNLFNIEAKKHYGKTYKDFEIDESNSRFLNIFCKYFAQDLAFETDYKGKLHKGLYVFGGNGTGKTSSFEIIQQISKSYSIKQFWTPIVCVKKVVEQFNLSESGKKDYIIQYYSKGKYMFDDLGSESEASNYGKEDIFIRILETRYNQFISKGIKTHITSNLSFEDIKKRYGTRVFDRFFQMFNQIQLDGKSRR